MVLRVGGLCYRSVLQAVEGPRGEYLAIRRRGPD